MARSGRKLINLAAFRYTPKIQTTELKKLVVEVKNYLDLYLSCEGTISIHLMSALSRLQSQLIYNSATNNLIEDVLQDNDLKVVNDVKLKDGSIKWVVKRRRKSKSNIKFG